MGLTIILITFGVAGVLFLLGVRAMYMSKKSYASGTQVTAIAGRVETGGLKPMQHYRTTATYKIKGKKYKAIIRTGAFQPLEEGHKVTLVYKEEEPGNPKPLIYDFHQSYWIAACIILIIGSSISFFI